MLTLKPPTHTADAGAGIYIHTFDPAWDSERWEAELAASDAKIVAEHTMPDGTVDAAKVLVAREAARLRHPITRFSCGRTRFQLDAPDWRLDGTPCTVRDYLRGPATLFHVRRLTFSQQRQIDNIADTRDRHLAMLKHGLVRIDSAEWTWERGSLGVTDDVIEALHACDPSLPFSIGQAIALLNRRLDQAEDFR